MAFSIKKYTYSSMTLWEFIESAGGASLLTKGLSYIAKWVKIKRSVKPVEGIKAIVKLYGEMDWVLSQTSLDRINIYVLEDSGHKPNPVLPQYMTCMYDAFSKPLISDREDFQRFLVDKSFISIFNVVCEQGFHVVNKPDINDPSTKLRDSMLIGRMEHQQVFLLAQTEVRTFFVCLSSRTKTYEQLTEDEKIDARVSVDRMRGIFKEAIKHLRQ